MAKREISNIQNPFGKIQWILEFSKSLEQTYLAMLEILTKGRKLQGIEYLTVLGLWQGLWPLLVKVWRIDQSPQKAHFNNIAKCLERWAFLRALGSRRSDYKVGSLHIFARDFSGDFNKLETAIDALINGIADRDDFEANLRYSDFYNWERNLARYIMWRYENSLRTKVGGQGNRIKQALEFREYVGGIRRSIRPVSAGS